MTAGEAVPAGADQATMVDLVEAAVVSTPEAPAVVAGSESLSFGELDARANRLAHRLVELGVGPEVVVGVCLERSVEMAVAILAVLKAGGACLPLDPAYPAERLAFMVGDASAPVILSRAGLAEHLASAGAEVLALDDDDAWGSHGSEAPGRRAGPESLAYVLYTSGSTGEPRGVMLEHRALVHHNRVAASLYGLGPGDRVLQFCSISFDVSIEEMFPTWAAGATVVMRPEDLPLLGREWSAWLAQAGITVLNLPTAYWHEWVRDLHARGDTVAPAVRLVVVGGEKALGRAYARWLEVGGSHVRWINAYGPTEAAVMATVYEPAHLPAVVPGQDLPDPPIGRPLPGVKLHLLDPRGHPVPPGVAGEIHIGGPGLARGYLNQPELSAQRFVADPFDPTPGARLYRSGDLGRLRPDGELEFGGRLDTQVKVRGFRVECGEVEAALRGHPAVEDAVVVAREDIPGDRRLVAYVVARPDEGDEGGEAGGAGGVSAPELRRYLGTRLPAHMVPGAFAHLPALPLTANGKVDRDSLPAPGPSPTAGGAAPLTRTEAVVASVWSKVLGVEGIGADDDFFDLGGHSLLATQVIAQLREELGLDVPLRAIFENPTVRGLALAVDDLPARVEPAGPPLSPQPRPADGRVPLSLAQEQMLELETRAPGRYNVTALHRFDGPADTEVLARALSLVVERHESLRTRFVTGADGPHQRVEASMPLALETVDLSPLSPPDRDEKLAHMVADHDAQAFEVDDLPLVRATLFHLHEGASQLVVTFDHLVCDGTSAYIFLDEAISAYEALQARRPPRLALLPVQYADYALWQRRHITAARLESQLDYWRRKLAGMPHGPVIAFDHLPPALTRRIAARELSLGPDLYASLEGRVREARVTMFVLCVAATQALFSRFSGQTDIVLSTTLSGRQRAELERLIGLFSGIGRLRSDLGGDPTFESVLQRARETVLGLFEHQDIPFMRVRRSIAPDFPSEGLALMSALPVELQYFHTGQETWAPGLAAIRSAGQEAADDLYFRGQLHPLSVTFLDDGASLWSELRYKADFYSESTIERLADGLAAVLDAVAQDPGLRVSELPVSPRA